MGRCRRLALIVVACLAGGPAIAATHNALMLNLVNTVSSDGFLDKGRADPVMQRVEGNGQNWVELMVVQGDDLGGGQFGNTLDLRGWKFDWAYDKALDEETPEQNKLGHGTMTFSQDPLWAAVPKGTFITINEWKEVYYLNAANTPAGYDPAGVNAVTPGLKRDGGISGVGGLQGNAFNPSIHEKRDFATNTQWNPKKTGGVDWEIHVWAGERNEDTTYKYFSFSGEVFKGDSTPLQIGTEDAGLFTANNDAWQWTIRDDTPNNETNIVQGPYGERVTGLGSTWNVNSAEVLRLEAFNVGTGATQATYLGAGVANYRDGSSSTYGQPNTWSSGGGLQDLSPLRSWIVDGDVTLDGHIDGADFLAWQRGVGKLNPSLTDGDLDGDGNVNGADLIILKNRFGAAATAIATASPECNSLVLATIAVVAASTRRGKLRRRIRSH